MYKHHPVCVLPEPQERLWRYMNLPKFLDLLETKELYFTQLHRMEDGYEGALSTYSIEALRQQLLSLGHHPEDVADKLAEETYRLNQFFTYVNCWHSSLYESMAMWKQYGDDGIAIRTTFDRFQNALVAESKDIHIGKVRYGNYTDTLMNFGVSLDPIFFKRRVFDFEKEVRAALMILPEESGPTMDDMLSLDRQQPAGTRVCVDLEMLIDTVYVSPGKPSWYRDLIDKLLARYDYGFRLENSSVDKRPVFR